MLASLAMLNETFSLIFKHCAKANIHVPTFRLLLVSWPSKSNWAFFGGAAPLASLLASTFWVLITLLTRTKLNRKLWGKLLRFSKKIVPLKWLRVSNNFKKKIENFSDYFALKLIRQKNLEKCEFSRQKFAWLFFKIIFFYGIFLFSALE